MASGKTRAWIKEGALVDGYVKRPIIKAKQIIYNVFEKYGLDVYWTSGIEGNHGSGSLHPFGLAIDTDLPPYEKLVDDIYDDIVAGLKDVSKYYQVILHKNSHYHCEYDIGVK